MAQAPSILRFRTVKSAWFWSGNISAPSVTDFPSRHLSTSPALRAERQTRRSQAQDYIVNIMCYSIARNMPVLCTSERCGTCGASGWFAKCEEKNLEQPSDSFCRRASKGILVISLWAFAWGWNSAHHVKNSLLTIEWDQAISTECHECQTNVKGLAFATIGGVSTPLAVLPEGTRVADRALWAEVGAGWHRKLLLLLPPPDSSHYEEPENVTACNLTAGSHDVHHRVGRVLWPGVQAGPSCALGGDVQGAGQQAAWEAAREGFGRDLLSLRDTCLAKSMRGHIRTVHTRGTGRPYTPQPETQGKG